MTDNFEVLKGMLESVDAFAPVFDAADGMRLDMERRGWSPTMAEQIAGMWLANIMTLIFNAQQPQGE